MRGLAAKIPAAIDPCRAARQHDDRTHARKRHPMRHGPSALTAVVDAGKKTCGPHMNANCTSPLAVAQTMGYAAVPTVAPCFAALPW